MNEAMEAQNIKQYFERIEKPVSMNFTYSYSAPKFFSFLLWNGLAAFKYKHYIVAFFPEEIILVPLSFSGNFKDNPIRIFRNEIQNIQIKEGLLQYKIKVQTEDQTIKLKCTKFIINQSWQKENIAYLEGKAWYSEELSS